MQYRPKLRTTAAFQHENINDYINKLTANNSVTRVAVYFRESTWFGGSELGRQHGGVFAPSSLLKVPVMMAYYKEAESNPAILSQKIAYASQPEGIISQNYAPEHPIVLGQTYTVEQLIEKYDNWFG